MWVESGREEEVVLVEKGCTEVFAMVIRCECAYKLGIFKDFMVQVDGVVGRINMLQVV